MRQFSTHSLGADALGGLAAPGTVGLVGLIEDGAAQALRPVTRVFVGGATLRRAEPAGFQAHHRAGGPR